LRIYAENVSEIVRTVIPTVKLTLRILARLAVEVFVDYSIYPFRLFLMPLFFWTLFRLGRHRPTGDFEHRFRDLCRAIYSYQNLTVSDFVRRHHEIPAHKRERGSVARLHRH
jgi:hypothetical protein